MDVQAALQRRAQVQEFLRKHRIGLLTLLFTDIVGSTQLKNDLGDHTAVELIQRHHALLREILRGFNEGEEIQTAGDSFFLVFAKPSDAVKFSLCLQARLRALARDTGHAVLDRIGIHVGEVFIDQSAEATGGKDLYGIQIDTCARVMSIGCGDQILLSRFAFDNARQVLKGQEISGVERLTWLNHGPYLFKGMEEPLDVCEVGEAALAALAPPTGNDKASRTSDSGEVVLGWRPALEQVVPGTQWVLEEKLGEGGFGEVWLGRHQRLNHRQVFKFCFRASQVRSLEREVAIFQMLARRVGNHPNIVNVRDVYFAEPPYYLTMDYVEGKDLRSWCDARGGVRNLPLAERLEIVAQIAEGLQAAHDAGVIHRDVKPGNILVRRAAKTPDQLEVKLTDFGIGQILSEEFLTGLTQAGVTRSFISTGGSGQSGTHLYMAPELIAGQPASPRSDIYSLGVVLFQLLVGDLKAPVTTTWARQIDDPLLREDLALCFAGDPEERFAGAAQLAKNLRALGRRRTDLAAQKAAAAAREREAYHRGMMRTASVAAVIVAAVTLLAVLAFKQTWRARAAEANERSQRQQIEVQQEVNRQRLVRLNLAYGQMDEGDLLSSLQWFIEALRLDQGDPAREEMHRVRVATVLRQCPRLVQFWSHELPVSHAEFSPDGRRVLAAHASGPALLYDVDSGKLLGTLPLTGGSFPFAAFSANGRQIVTAGGKFPVTVWDADSGQARHSFTNPSPALHASFSPDGRQVIAAYNDGMARIWNLTTDLPPVLLRHSNTVSKAWFSPDGTRVVTASLDGRARVWSAISGAPLTGWLIHRGRIESVSFSPDSRLVLTASRDQTAGLWQVTDDPTAARRSATLQHNNWLTSARFSPDGRQVLTTSYDRTARIWDAATGQPLSSPLLHQHSVMGGEFSPDGRRVLTACFDQTAQVWDPLNGRHVLSPLKHSAHVTEGRFSPDGHRLLTVGGDQIIRVWDMAGSGKPAALLPHPGFVQAAEFSPDGASVATAGADGQSMIWDARTGESRATPPLHHNGRVNAVAFSPDGKRLLTAGNDGVAQLWDARTGEPVGPPLAHGSNKVLHAAFSANDGRVLTATEGGVVRTWSATNQTLLGPEIRFTNGLKHVAFSPDGSQVVGISKSGVAAAFATSTGAPLPWQLASARPVVRAAFSPDGGKLVLCFSDATFDPLSAQVWDTRTGLRLPFTLDHGDGVLHAAFSPDGRRIVTASEDGTAGLWDADTGKLLTPFLRHQYQVVHAAFSTDGRRVVTASDDHTVRVWDASTGEAVTPPLKHSDTLRFAAFNTDGRELVTISDDGRATLWNLGEDKRPVADLVQLAQLLNSRRIDESARGAVALEPAALRDLWRAWRAKDAGSFTTTEPDVIAWHRQEADDCHDTRNWPGAIEHLNSLVAAEPNQWQYLQRRAQAWSGLGQWTNAIADWNASLKIFPDPWAMNAVQQIHRRHLNGVEPAGADGTAVLPPARP